MQLSISVDFYHCTAWWPVCEWLLILGSWLLASLRLAIHCPISNLHEAAVLKTDDMRRP